MISRKVLQMNEIINHKLDKGKILVSLKNDSKGNNIVLDLISKNN